ncbi:MAG TPA: hypothetical protein VNY56_09880 [Methylomirabilota bacterium]|jgi:hypothetical protein|nr:hypothetical protein [Methylomirabilota bacterium]
MELVDSSETMAGENETHPGEGGPMPLSIHRMSSAELLRFGMRAKFRCSNEANPNDSRLTALMAQLAEARAEWNRRHPELPLRDSF